MKGRICIVTGGNTGIGKATVEGKADPRVLDDAFAERLWTESERLIATAQA